MDIKDMIFIIFSVIILFLIKYVYTYFKELNHENIRLRKIIEIEKNKYKELYPILKQLKLYEKDELAREDIIINGKKYKKTNQFYGKRALVGDYLFDSLNNTRKILQKLGMIVDIVESGDEIYEKISVSKIQSYDVIFTNRIYKKGDSGPLTLTKLKEDKEFDIPTIMLTVDSLDSNQFNNFKENYGFYDCLKKPIKEKEIINTLDKLFKENK